MLNTSVQPQTCLYCSSVTQNESLFCCTACSFLHDLESGIRLSPAASTSEWGHLDQPEFQAELDIISTKNQTKIYRIYVKGMICSSCTQLLERLPEIDERILNSEVSFVTGELRLETALNIRLSEIARWIESFGYTPHFLTKSEDVSKFKMADSKDLVKRIAVAGFCTGNIMLLAIARYAGLDGGLRSVFSFFEILLMLPVLVYAAQPFYRGAVTSLKRKQIHLDFIISFSLLTTFALNIFTYFKWGQELYLDSLSAFTFLILIGRWMIKKAEQKANQIPTEQLFSNSHPVQIIKNGARATLPLSHVCEGDLLFCRKDEIVPCDTILISNSAAFDTSLVSGESYPRVSQRGMAVPAGMRCLTPEVLLRVEKAFTDTELYRALKMSEKDFFKRSKNLVRLDQIGQIILSGALILSLICFPLFLFVFDLGFTESWSRVLSLLVVTCPCALAFGGPLAYAFSLKNARTQGIIVSSAEVFDKLGTAQNIIFDKTGTLTTGLLKLHSSEPPILSAWQRGVILALESTSHHPIAFALREAFEEEIYLSNTIEVVDKTEIIGEKVFGIVDGDLYSLEKARSDDSNLVAVDFFQGKKRLARLYFEDQIRDEAPELIRTLRQSFNVYICSGDKSVRVQEVANRLGLNDLSCFGNMSPLNKYDFIKAHPNSIMLGDGFNDAAALAAADVGIAIEGPLSHSIKNTGVCFLNSGLSPLNDLLQLNTRLQSTLKRNLNFTIAYNLIAGLCSVLGLVNPLVAAILMPLSSVFVLTQIKRGLS